MGKKGKKLRSDLKKMKKVAQKRANRAMYDSWRDSGNNSKSFRAKKRSKKQGTGEKGKHLVSNCGNQGCQRCNPRDRKKQIILSIRNSIRLINKLFPVKKLKPQLVGGNQGYN